MSCDAIVERCYRAHGPDDAFAYAACVAGSERAARSKPGTLCDKWEPASGSEDEPCATRCRGYESYSEMNDWGARNYTNDGDASSACRCSRSALPDCKSPDLGYDSFSVVRAEGASCLAEAKARLDRKPPAARFHNRPFHIAGVARALSADSLEACHALCARDLRCQGLSYNAATKRCRTYETADASGKAVDGGTVTYTREAFRGVEFALTGQHAAKQVASADDCRAACTEDANCRAFMCHPVTGRCILYDMYATDGDRLEEEWLAEVKTGVGK